jgi:hypothetical protein
MADDDRARTSRLLACPHVAHAVDHGEAAPAVSCETEGPALARVLSCAEDRERDRVSRAIGNRGAVDDDARHLAAEGVRRRDVLGPGVAGRRRSEVGHWRILAPSGSWSGRGWMRAGRRRPTISISKLPCASGASGEASAAGT